MKFYFMMGIILILGVMSIQAAVTLPITDNFNTPNADQSWSDYDSTYELIEAFSPSAPSGDGYVMNVNDGSGWQKIHLTADDGTLGDYKITAWLYVPTSDGTNWSRVGIFGRAQTIGYLSACYYIFSDTDANDCLRVGRYTADHAEWINYYEGLITLDAWHKFELTLSGTTIEAELDDVVVYTGSDATEFSTGYFGILCRQATETSPVALCDRITIETPSSSVEDWSLY